MSFTTENLSSNPGRGNGTRITMVLSSLVGGGAERVAADLCRYLSEAGHDVSLLTLTGDDPDAYPVPEGTRRERIEIRHDATSPFWRLRFVVSRHLAMRRKIRAFRPDVVVSFIDQINIRTILCLLGTGIPVIVSERVHPAHVLLGPTWRLARRLCYPLAAAVTVQTADGAAWLRNYARIKGAVVIPNAVRHQGDIRAGACEAPAGSSQPFVLAMGRLAEQKGFDLLLEAFRRSGLSESGWRLVILGEGPERAALERQAALAGIAEAVMLPGFVREIGPWLRKADMFVLSSRFEGFPNVLLEAMQVGVASISFDCPSGPRELIEHGINGSLVARDDVAGLAEEMRRLGSSPDLRSHLGANAKSVNQRYAPAEVYGRWVSLIDAVAGRQ